MTTIFTFFFKKMLFSCMESLVRSSSRNSWFRWRWVSKYALRWSRSRLHSSNFIARHRFWSEPNSSGKTNNGVQLQFKFLPFLFSFQYVFVRKGYETRDHDFIFDFSFVMYIYLFCIYLFIYLFVFCVVFYICILKKKLANLIKHKKTKHNR